jgi:hypothetical protein
MEMFSTVARRTTSCEEAFRRGLVDADLSRSARRTGQPDRRSPSDLEGALEIGDKGEGPGRRFQLAEIVGTLLAIKRDGGQACNFEVDDAAAEELKTWLERPSAQVSDTSAFVTRRDQVEGIMGALLKLTPATVCNAAEEKLPASLKSILRR